MHQVQHSYHILLFRSFFSFLRLLYSEAATPAPTAAAAAAPRLRDLDRLPRGLKLRVLLVLRGRRDVASYDDVAGGGAGAGTISRVELL